MLQVLSEFENAWNLIVKLNTIKMVFIVHFDTNLLI